FVLVLIGFGVVHGPPGGGLGPGGTAAAAGRTQSGAELGPGVLDLVIGVGHSLLHAAEGVLAVLAGGGAQHAALLLGLGHDLVGPLFGLPDDGVLVHQALGILLGLVAQV